MRLPLLARGLCQFYFLGLPNRCAKRLRKVIQKAWIKYLQTMRRVRVAPGGRVRGGTACKPCTFFRNRPPKLRHVLSETTFKLKCVIAVEYLCISTSSENAFRQRIIMNTTEGVFPFSRRAAVSGLRVWFHWTRVKFLESVRRDQVYELWRNASVTDWRASSGFNRVLLSYLIIFLLSLFASHIFPSHRVPWLSEYHLSSIELRAIDPHLK